jgi:CHAT domain-containing protein/tetratricopeptide (TPR) repeat protein
MASGWIARRLAWALFSLGLVCGIVLATTAHAQQQDDLAQLRAEVGRLHSQGKYREAIPIAERYVALARQKHGDEHAEVAAAMSWLAFVYRDQGRYAEAEPLYRRSLAVYEKARGPEHIDVGRALNNLAVLYSLQGRDAEAEPLLRRGLAVYEKALGPKHIDVGTALNDLAILYRRQGRYAEAEPLYRRSLSMFEKALGPDHPRVGQSLNNLAILYSAQGRYAEAEPLYRRILAIREKALGPDHPDVGQSLGNLAVLYSRQHRHAEAEPLYKRSLVISEKALGPEHPRVGGLLNNLALLYESQGRYGEAEPLYRRSLAIYEKALGPEHPDVGTPLNNLAILYDRQGRYAEVEPLYKRSLAISEKALGPEHPDVGTPLNNLAALYGRQGRYAEAETLHKRSLAIREKALGPDHPDLVQSLHNLALLAVDQRDWAGAAGYWRRSAGVIRRRASRGLVSAAEISSKGEAQPWGRQFTLLVRTTHRLATRGAGRGAQAQEMFETAQWSQSSEAGASLAQMAARSAKGSPELAGLVREWQDLVSEWQAKDKLLIAAKSEEPAKRKADAEKALAARLAAIDTRLAEIDGRLKQDFPDYAAVASPAPLSVTDVQTQLGADEALVLILDTSAWSPFPEETFIWVVTKTDVRWIRSDLGAAALTREVAALRCGLDETAWEGVKAETCAKTLGIPLAKAPRRGESLPFDHARAHRLYTALFGEVADLIKGKHLLIVPSGPLTQLPFQVLVTRPPTSGDHRAAAWLARDHAITVLPAVSSLKALRRVGKPSAAPRPMIGFGNPLLDGPGRRYAQLAKLARDKQRCPEARGRRKVALVAPRASVAHVEMRSGLADLAHIKVQVPLPETADELCAVAEDVKADVARDIRLGMQATERVVKRLSASGELAKYRIVHFATHGVMAGQLDGTREPGLILTPPDKATEEDDGYLSASEIAALKLDADWVILSACNTAAGATTSAEALSGLARAFIYAQARALLVSHWEVYSDATVKLVTAAVREMAGDPKVGRAEAMRRSMLALIDKGAREEAHPAYWAPFIVVGEGAAMRR